MGSHAERFWLPRMSRSERDRRWALVRGRMQERGLEVIVLWVATTWDFYTANARYLCPVGGNAEFNVLVFPASGEPTCFVHMPTFVEGWAQRPGLGRRYQSARRHLGGARVAKRITELGLGNGNIGMDGLAGPLDPDGLGSTQRRRASGSRSSCRKLASSRSATCWNRCARSRARKRSICWTAPQVSAI